MENQYVAQAKAAYAAKNYSAALDLYNQCLQNPAVQKEPGDMGFLYHQIGNCLVQMGAFAEAVNAYTQATADSAYDACGAVNCNLAKAYAALHDFEHAVAHFEIAASDSKYDSRYKAYMGMGNAYMKLGKNAEAGIAFREAALDGSNADPTKALLNLGVCFMALDRPVDAVQSYESALRFNMDPSTRNKMYANLGQAYVACGQMQQAMNAFETALADKTYFLSDSASVDYSRAATAVATGSAATQIVPTPVANDMSGLDVSSAGAPLADEFSPYDADPQYFPAEAYGYDAQDSYASGEERFLYASNEELERYSKGIARQDRKRRNVGLKIVLVIVILLLALAGAGVFLYMQGYGYPTQEAVVSEVFATPENGAQYFAENIDPAVVDNSLALVVQDNSLTVDGVNMSVSASTVYVTADTPEGGQVSYKVEMVRDLLSWKISNIELMFDSQQ